MVEGASLSESAEQAGSRGRAVGEKRGHAVPARRTWSLGRKGYAGAGKRELLVARGVL